VKGGGTIVVACVLALVACAPVETGVVSEAEESGALSDTEPESATIEPAPPVTDTVEESAVSFNVGLYSIEQADSLWVVVNKQRIYTPIDYAPIDLVVPEVPFNNPPLLREEAAQALESMLHAAREADADFVIQSSYRSFVVQQRIKQRSIERWGPEVSDGRSARAGHSEHQSGLAVDLTTKTGLCTLDPCFGQTSVGEWLAENSWRYGFILRYLPGKTDITGYIYEPWHFRYVGLELAEQVYQRGYPTLEEFFGLPPAPNYLD
jgi:D-alanyl-D-alanine carboxypeptidase